MRSLVEMLLEVVGAEVVVDITIKGFYACVYLEEKRL